MQDGHEVPVQQYLQGAFLDMFDVVAKKLGCLEGVLGFQVAFHTDSFQNFAEHSQVLNEPHRGYIDIASLHAFDYNTDLHLSYVRMYLVRVIKKSSTD